jgi:hypothetical protein
VSAGEGFDIFSLGTVLSGRTFAVSIFDVEARKMAEEAAERERMNEQKAALNNVLAHKTLDELRDYLSSRERTDISVSVHENRVTASAGQAQLVITCEKSGASSLFKVSGDGEPATANEGESQMARRVLVWMQNTR